MACWAVEIDLDGADSGLDVEIGLDAVNDLGEGIDWPEDSGLDVGIDLDEVTGLGEDFDQDEVTGWVYPLDLVMAKDLLLEA